MNVLLGLLCLQLPSDLTDRPENVKSTGNKHGATMHAAGTVNKAVNLIKLIPIPAHFSISFFFGFLFRRIINSYSAILFA